MPARTETAAPVAAVATPPVEEKKEEKKPRFPKLADDRAVWVAEHARPAVSVCLCGCGGSTKGRFVPGHDATLKEALKTGAASGCQHSKAALATFGW